MLSRFELTIAILFGAGTISKVGEEAAKLGHKAMVVTYPDIRRIGLLDKVLRDLKENKIDAIVFEKVEPNPRSTTIDEGAAIARKEKIDLVIGLGGGSAMDTAKGIALASSGTASIWDYMLKRADVKGVVPPIIQIPTMAGTGSEINYSAVITNWETHIKSGLGDSRLQAKVAIIDPEITLSVPLHQTKAGGIDILFSCLRTLSYRWHTDAIDRRYPRDLYENGSEVSAASDSTPRRHGSPHTTFLGKHNCDVTVCRMGRRRQIGDLPCH